MDPQYVCFAVLRALQVPTLETGMIAPAFLLLLLLLVVLMVAVWMRVGGWGGVLKQGLKHVQYSFDVCLGQAMAGGMTANGKEEGACFVCGMGYTTAFWPHTSRVFHKACV
jgi:hypothetical protein